LSGPSSFLLIVPQNFKLDRPHEAGDDEGGYVRFKLQSLFLRT